MHSFFYDHTAAETVVDGDPGDVVRAGGGGGSGADQYCVIPPDPQTDLPNDEEFMIADFQELLTGVRASTPLPPWPRPGPGPVEPLPRAVRSMLTSTSRVLGSKRSRKGQAKKVVCVPAPAADQESNKGNVVVPSDLWAWRKYGQKPIKGSPYPRGYYRCSSSKGCLARKQVERSPSDPTMLLITYSTAEHNHALPTRRNSLAGSSRSAHAPPENSNMIPQSSGSTNHHAEAPPAASLALVDQMVVEEEITKCEFEHEIFGNSYQPSQLVPESESFDFFAEVLGGGGGGGGLDNIPDPVQSLIFSSRDQEDRYLQLEGETKALDPLSLFDWDIGN